jgi:hypothetical protein
MVIDLEIPTQIPAGELIPAKIDAAGALGVRGTQQ